MDLMKKMSPSKIDAEIHSLSPLVGGSVVMVTYMMEFLLDRLQTRRDFELVQSYMSVILKVRALLCSLPIHCIDVFMIQDCSHFPKEIVFALSSL